MFLFLPFKLSTRCRQLETPGPLAGSFPDPGTFPFCLLTRRAAEIRIGSGAGRRAMRMPGPEREGGTIVIGREKLVIEANWCKGCGICAAFCPRQVLEIQKEKVVVKNPEACVFCGQCELRCPDYAIYLVNVEE